MDHVTSMPHLAVCWIFAIRNGPFPSTNRFSVRILTMKSSRHQFDPEGDVELILKSVNTQELISDIASLRLATMRLSLQVMRMKSSILLNQPGNLTAQAADQQQVALAATNETSALVPIQLVKGKAIAPSPFTEIRMQLSSRHLILASPYFRKMLNGPWMEGSQVPREISASGWDEKALVIVLDIIHGHHRDVPKSLDLQTLTKVAVIVDYYGCEEAMEPYARPWILDTKETLPQVYDDNCILWLCVSWVFSQSRIFEAMTELIVKHTEGPIDVPHLPIGGILEAIETKRISLIDQILASLEALCDKLERGKKGCSWECSSMLLGLVMKGKRTLAELQPPIIRPYQGAGHSLTSVLSKVGAFRDPRWAPYDESLLRRTPHACTVATLLRPSIQKFQQEMRCFKLEDFGRTGL
ncbi:hypothetical protein B0J13DRAFT_564793 [Dactylonectria estremocensis]|uniref:BTB domain-containing protein n=1 Tax=Dactylonectria estremocensis TaxID=1079267 RepID=A0A9P9IMI1_9HYPO|nr:hypothetical protein B0J13DRAFT_564793 [Dactylonectria estremocensis]